MNTGVSSSYQINRSIEDSLAINTQMIGDDENSIISWYNINDDNENDEDMSSSNFEDFIDIDMAPDTHETMICSRYDDVIDPVREAACLRNFKEMLLTHRTIFREKCRHVINMNINEGERTAIVKSKADYAGSFANTPNVSCYNEGIVAILQIFNRIDCFIFQYSATIKECHCSKYRDERSVSQIGYALETAGDNCEQCSMDYILDNLNSKFLANVAKAQFFTVKDIIDSVSFEKEIELGATSSHFNCQESSDPDTGWLRLWFSMFCHKDAVVAFVYNEMVNVDHTQRNKVKFQIMDYSTDNEFHLTMPMELVKDEELERRLLKDEIAYIMKNEMLKYEHRAEEFQLLINHKNERFHDMNVLGQIVGMFREQTIENFRDVTRPSGIHKIKVPNMHRHGVLVVVPLSVTIGHHLHMDIV